MVNKGKNKYNNFGSINDIKLGDYLKVWFRFIQIINQ